jgi:hypothetical protein
VGGRRGRRVFRPVNCTGEAPAEDRRRRVECLSRHSQVADLGPCGLCQGADETSAPQVLERGGGLATGQSAGGLGRGAILR